jgi:predicted lipid-binding transport protein (Tim44 family)
MVGLGVASTAATIGLGVAFGLVGVAIGATFTVVAASYINNGVAKVVASSVVEGVKGRFGRTRQAPAPSHVKAPPAPQRTHHEHSPDAPNPSLIARARHLAARARDTIAGRNRRETINPALERLRETRTMDKRSCDS